MANDNMEVVFVLGSPGSGKGTVCKRIAEDFGYVHISGGELLRREREKENSQYKECIEEIFNKGQFVPPYIVCSLIETVVNESESKKFLFDAFPISMENLTAWEERVLSKKMKLNFVLLLDCPPELCEKRILSRGAAGSGRDDDKPEKLPNRFSKYKEDTCAVVEHFKDLKLLRRVDASKSPDEVYQEVRRYFQTADTE